MDTAEAQRLRLKKFFVPSLVDTMIDPVTLKKLKAFATRRRRLILIRGLCAFLMSLLLIMSGLALLDRFFIIPDPVRWVLSAIGYGLVGFILWKVCLRDLFHLTNRRELARMVEHADPSLREDLISAIELGSKKSEKNSKWDSPKFRALLQKDVAGRLADVEVAKLLPTRMVSFWTRMALVAVLLTVGLSFIPGLHFPQLLSRALLPGANLERPSDIIVTFVEPAPADRIVASGDTVDVLVEITGGNVDTVILESKEGNLKGEKTKLKRVRSGRFSGAISVSLLDIDYRVRAEGTITKTHTLTSRPRPQATAFTKVYTYPTYTELPALTETHDHGAVSALEGSEVMLQIAVNQKIAKGELHLQSHRKEMEEKVIVLVQGEDGLMRGTIPITADYNFYRVHLEAEESGFTNKFSPDYEIRSVPDLVPTIVMTTPETNTEAALNATLPVSGVAQDDVGLAEIRQAWRINKGEWEEQVLVSKPEGVSLVELIADSQWDLRSLPLKARDTLYTRLVAVDLKGNRGESPVARLSITVEPDNKEKREWAKKEKDLAKDLEKLAKKTADAAHNIGEAKKVMKKDKPLDVEDQQKLVRAQSETAEAQRQAEQAWEKLKEMQREAPSRAEAKQLEKAAEMLADIRNQRLDRAQDQIQDWGKADKEEFTEQDERADQHAWQAHDNANRLAEAAKALAAEDEAAILADDLKELAEKQKEVVEAVRNNETPEAAKEQQEIASARSEKIEDALEEFAKLTDGGERGTAEREAREQEKERTELEQALAQENPDKGKNQREAEDAQRQTEDAAHQMENMQEALARRADEAQRKLDERAIDPSREIGELVHQANELASKRERAEQAADKGNNDKNTERLADEVAGAEEEVSERLEALADRLRDEAEFAEQNSATNDAQENADMNKAAQAMDALADDVNEKSSAEDAKEVAKNLENLRDALESLEAGAEAEELSDALAELGDAEHNASGQKEQATEENPEIWNAVEEQLKDLPQALEKVADAQKAKEQAQQAANSEEARSLDQEMSQREQAERRGDENRAPQPQAAQAEKLQEQMEQISDAIEPQVAEARDALEQMAPGVPEQLRDLAQEAQAQADAAQELADAANAADAEPQSSAEIAAKAQEMLAQSENTAERMDEISDALASEANTENLLTEESRESARDADDAIAQLEESADSSEQAMGNLADAVQSNSPQEQSQALESAASDQAELAQALNELADQLEAIAGDDPQAAEEARLALRESEQDTGVQPALNEAYEQAAELAQLMEQAGASPQEALAALEQELQRNQPMQEGLSEISQDALSDAASTLAEAADAEGQVSDMLEQAAAAQTQPEGSPTPAAPPQMASAAQQQANVGEQVSDAASELERAARHEERLGNEALAQALAEAGSETQALAQNEAAEAMASIQNAQQQSQSAPAPQAAQQASSAAETAQNAIAQQAQELGAMAGQQPQSPSQQSASTPPSAQSLDPNQDGQIGPFDSGNPEQAQFLAEALDALDQAMNGAPPAEGQSPSSPQTAQNQSPGQPSPPESGQPSPPQAGQQSPAQSESQSQSQSAQQALAAATQSQAAAMAQARAQSMTPGQMSPSEMQAMLASSPSQPSNKPPQVIGQAMDPNGNPLTTRGSPADIKPAPDWGKLPSKVAKDLIEGQRQEVSPDYRTAVESYYKAIAERASKNN